MSMQQWLTHALTLADIAGAIARKYYRQLDSNQIKADQSPVTEADLAIEEAIRTYLGKHLPEHGLWGEEFGLRSGNSEYLWIIDPIDGTAPFTMGKPTFTTLIALHHANTPLLGIIDQAILRERWIGMYNTASTFQMQPCYSSTRQHLSHARLNITTPHMFNSEQEINVWQGLQQQVAVRAYGGDAYAFGLLASGHIDLILEAQLKFYDVAALIPVIEGAGGVITDWQGRSLTEHFQGQCLASANTTLHQEALQWISHCSNS